MLNTINAIQSMILQLYNEFEQIEDEEEAKRHHEVVSRVLGMTIEPALKKLGNDEAASMAQLQEDLSDE